METLKELRAKYKQLKSESDIIHNQIKVLERQEALSNFTVGDCSGCADNLCMAYNLCAMHQASGKCMIAIYAKKYCKLSYN